MIFLLAIGTVPRVLANPWSTNRATVVTVQSASATSLFIPEPAAVRSMFDKGLAQFAGRPSAAEAWHSLIATNDVVGIKVCSGPGPVSGTRPAVVEALVASLLAAGHPPGQIILWDKRPYDLRTAGWPELAARLGVRCISASESGWDSARFYENALLGRPLFDELEYEKKEPGTGRKSYVTRLLTQQITKLISVAPVLNHNLAGVNGHLYGLAFGSFDNTLRFEGASGPMAEAVPDLLLSAQAEILDRLVLCVGDALVCQYRGEERTLLHYAVALNELRFSKDPVALDAMALADIEKARKSNPTDGEKPSKAELYGNAEIGTLGVADLKRVDIVRAP